MTSEQEKNRNNNGQFKKGQSGNPGGRPAGRTKYLKKLDSRMKMGDWQDIIDKAIEQAKRGDNRARQWLSDYLLGKPPQAIELGGEGGGKLEVVVSYASKPDSSGAS